MRRRLRTSHYEASCVTLETAGELDHRAMSRVIVGSPVVVIPGLERPRFRSTRAREQRKAGADIERIVIGPQSWRRKGWRARSGKRRGVFQRRVAQLVKPFEM